MPNTLAHVGGQGAVTRLIVRNADPKWIYLGCVIPDVPWILQRIIWFVVPDIDPHILRSYLIVQASLFSCLVLSVAIALLSRQFGKTNLILGLNAFLHLLLDALQTKWASGVHFLAPFSWRMSNWDLFWPESWVTYVLTGFGLVFMVWYRKESLQKGFLVQRNVKRIVGACILLATYFVLPLLFLQEPVEANNHYIETYSVSEDREGRYVEFDRARYLSTLEGDSLANWDSGQLAVEGIELQSAATVSVRGVYTDDNEVRAIEHHIHSDWFRDGASYLGLGLVFAVWVVALVKNELPSKI